MKNDIIKCSNCGKTFKDDTKQTDKVTGAGNTYQWQGQDSRTNNFKNMCPFCYGTNTKNTHETTTKKQKFIYDSKQRDGETVSNPKGKKRIIRKPNMETECIARKVLGTRQSCDIKEEDEKYSDEYGRTVPQPEVQSSGLSKFRDHVQTSSIDFVAKTGGTFDTSPVKSFTPIELMERKLKTQHKELLLPPDNLSKYRGWRYDKRYKNECKKVQ